jgi:GNAT superfamily N-acetyltransferase
MACQYTIDGKVMEAWEFDDYLRTLPTARAARFMPGVSSIPDAPFTHKTDAWVALAVKRVLAMAAEGGYDKVAFVNGEQSAERYSLEKQVQQVMAKKDGDGFIIFVRDSVGKNHNMGIRSANELPGVVGKELAEKIASQKKDMEVYEGLDLKVGGEGMKAFYDKIVPSVVKDVAKKVGGGKLTEVGIDTAEDGDGYEVVLPSGKVVKTTSNAYQAQSTARAYPGAVVREVTSITKQLALDITPAMREAVGAGMPMFSNRAKQQAEILNTGTNHVTAKVGGRTAGKASAWIDSSGKFTIQDVAVSAPFRRRGIATQMYRELEQRAGRELQPADSLSDDAFEFWKSYRPDAVAYDLRHRKDELLGASVEVKGRSATITHIGARGVTAKFDGADGVNSEVTIAASRLPEALHGKPAFSNRTSVPMEISEAILGAPLGAAKSHEDYAAAKGGNDGAAMRLASDLVSPDLVARVMAMAGTEGATLVPVISVEATGKNKIPQAVANVLGHAAGMPVASDIVQADSPKRTSMEGLDRIFSAPEFDGPVTEGQDYILVDDTLTQGATFASLASHIQQHGGRVIGAVALTGKQYSAKLKPSTETLDQLREKFGDIESQFQAATGYGFGALTESEARYLANFKPADTVRDRIIAAGSQSVSSRNAGNAEKVTDSPAFKRWFADSKVVDADGKPLVVFHGTRPENKFTEFEEPEPFDGIYFTPDIDYAKGYTESLFDDDAGPGDIHTVYLSIQNPYIVRTKDGSPEWESFAYRGLDRAELEAQGYDGAMLYLDGYGLDQVMAFRPNQIKSAIGNNGDFDPANSDIRFSNKAQVETPAFKKWFGDGAVVGDGGTPLVVYHGSPEKFGEGKNTSVRAAKYRPFWVTPSAELAGHYARGGSIAPLFVNIKNPANLTEMAHELLGTYNSDKELMSENPDAFWSEDDGDIAGNAYVLTNSTDVMDKLLADGYDSVTLEENPGVWSYGILSPGNVKSASGNNGDFDGANPDIRFSNKARADLRAAADKIAAMDPEVRDNTHLGDFPGSAQGYDLYEARKMSPKPSPKLKRVTDSNSFSLWQSYEYIANVDGEHFGVTKQEDPDEPDDDSKFVYSFARLDNPDAIVETMTDQLDLLFGEMRDAKGGVMFSNRAGGWDLPASTKFDDLVYKLQDKHVDTKRVIESIEAVRGQVDQDSDVYLQEELFHGRSAKRVEDFATDELKPLMQEMAKQGLSMDQVEEYLHARHAKEANALIASREGGMAEGGSGMTDAQADAYMRSLSADERAKLDGIAQSVDAILAKTRQMYADYGLESQDKVDGWEGMFKHYVPLQREQDGDSHGMGIGQGFSVKGKEVKGRTGSTRKVVDILANIAMQRERLIVRGEKNRVSMALVGLASANPNPDFWHIGPPPATRVYDPKTNSIVERVDPMYKSRSNVLVAKVAQPDGQVQEIAVTFNEDNARAMRMVGALKNLDAPQLEGLLGVSAKITRYFSAINTQYNPVFGIINLARDVQHAMITLDRTPLAKKKAKIAKDAISALAGIYRDMRAIRKGDHPASPWSELWEEFQREGGQTGFRDMFATSADRAEALQRELNPDSWMDGKYSHIFTANGTLKVPLSTAKKAMDGLFGWLSDYNESMENSVRLSAYKSAKEQGMSRQEAASLAKNLTVNFNRKGQVGSQVGSLYAFFNAAVQGTANMGQTLFTMRGGDVKTIRLSATGKKVVYGGMLIGTLQALALAAAGFGDDDPPEFVRQRSLIIPTGGKAYLSIPMPMGFNLLPNLGRSMTEYALGGFKGTAKRSLDIVGMFADNFNPIGNSGLSMQTLAPTALDPLVALTENRDFTGRPIARVSHNKAIPGFTQHKDAATALSKLMAETINSVTGGNAYVAGALSPTPDQIDYLLDQALGGVGREAAKLEMSGKALFNGESVPTYKVPLLGRLFGNAASQASEGNAFYANTDKLNALETEIKGMRKDGKNVEAAELARSHPEAALMATANVIERQIQRLRREKRSLVEQGVSRETVRAKEDQITAAMARLNRAMEKVSVK